MNVTALFAPLSHLLARIVAQILAQTMAKQKSSEKLLKRRLKPAIRSAVMLMGVLPLLSHAIEPIGLVAVEFTNEFKDSDVQRICQHFTITCADDARLWQLPSQHLTQQRPDHYYLIDSTPQLVELQIPDRNMAASGIAVKGDKLLGQWQFANYSHRSMGDDGTDIQNDTRTDTQADTSGDSQKRFIDPQLYPINQTETAIALVNQMDMSFDGGAASERSADFIQLLPKGKYEQVLSNVPFDGYYRYNACFSEQEKAQSIHCQEEGWQVLSVSMKDIKKPLYQWTLAYQNKIWAAHTPEDKAVIETHQVKVMPFADTANLF